MSRATPGPSRAKDTPYLSPESNTSQGPQRNGRSQPNDLDMSNESLRTGKLGSEFLGKWREKQKQNALDNMGAERGRRMRERDCNPQATLPRSRSPRRSNSPILVKPEDRVSPLFVSQQSFPEDTDDPEIADDRLDEKQRYVVGRAVSKRKNICVLGQAGTGKSTLIISLSGKFRDAEINVAVVAPTGIAAINVDGSTIHSYAELGAEVIETIQFYEDLSIAARDRLQSTEVLIIDEISMVSSELFTRLNRVMMAAHDNGLPFGGVQVIVVGDFCQLPPVKPFEHCIECGMKRTVFKSGDAECAVHGTVYARDQWAFRAPCWDGLEFEYVLLERKYRQQDEKFSKLLDRIWSGSSLNKAENRDLMNHPCDVEDAHELVALNWQRQERNDDQYKMLVGQEVEFRGVDDFEQYSDRHPELEYLHDRMRDGTLQALLGHRYDPIIRLKVGMRVMLLRNKNKAEGLVNGSRGVLVGFHKYKKDEIPLRDLQHQTFAGQQDGRLVSAREAHIIGFMQKNPCQLLPVVRFKSTSRDVVVWPDCSISERGQTKPRSRLSRTQIPLMADYASTVHKSQGMTLQKAVVDLGKAFCYGQAYVALSRVRSLQDVKVISLGKMYPMSDEVREFLETRFGIDFS